MGKEDEVFLKLEKAISEEGDTNFKVDSKPIESQRSTSEAVGDLVSSRQEKAMSDFDTEIEKDSDEKQDAFMENAVELFLKQDGVEYRVLAPMDKDLLDKKKFLHLLVSDKKAINGVCLEVYPIVNGKRGAIVYSDTHIWVDDLTNVAENKVLANTSREGNA